jgi:hypothetical protein
MIGVSAETICGWEHGKREPQRLAWNAFRAVWLSYRREVLAYGEGMGWWTGDGRGMRTYSAVTIYGEMLKGAYPPADLRCWAIAPVSMRACAASRDRP